MSNYKLRLVQVKRTRRNKMNTAAEILDTLIEDESTHINGEVVELSEITDKIDVEDMREAMQWALWGDNSKIEVLYTKEIEAML